MKSVQQVKLVRNIAIFILLCLMSWGGGSFAGWAWGSIQVASQMSQQR